MDRSLLFLNQFKNFNFSKAHINSQFSAGIYACKTCSYPVYVSTKRFQSFCGWPSFTTSIEKAVTYAFSDTIIEASCGHCSSHLGFVFKGEGPNAKDTWHCINPDSITFVIGDSSLGKI
jgi:peptide methionine sulfoxide reductase MsrB